MGQCLEVINMLVDKLARTLLSLSTLCQQPRNDQAPGYLSKSPTPLLDVYTSDNKSYEIVPLFSLRTCSHRRSSCSCP